MHIYPVNREWVHTQLVTPCLQGAEMVNRAWQGVNFHSVDSPHLSVKERVIYWVIGTTLLTPFVGTFVWDAWQTFGRPERLADPYSSPE